MDRRAFLQALAGLTATVALPHEAGARDRVGELLPRRKLGATGAEVTMVGLGGYHLGRMGKLTAQRTVEVALEGGVRFFDCAGVYHSGRSEEMLGHYVTPKYRDVVFLMSKSMGRDRASMERGLDASRRRLKADVIDLYQLHDIRSPEDAEARIRDGAVAALVEAREKGRIRHIGFTGHKLPEAHLRFLERSVGLPIAACQMPVNACDPSYRSFIAGVMPVLTQRHIGVLAMKTLAGGGFFGARGHGGADGTGTKVVPDRISVADAFNFVWSLPVSCLITGPDKPEELADTIAHARRFTSMTEEARRAVVERVADMAGRGVEYYKV